eukprot:SAG31_NODE_29210_length_399_cov_0.700000_1_plen_69_part_10
MAGAARRADHGADPNQRERHTLEPYGPAILWADLIRLLTTWLPARSLPPQLLAMWLAAVHPCAPVGSRI